MNNKKSIKSNVIYNFIKTIMALVFPLLSFSYSSRILGAEGLGKIQFSQSIIAYFIMISMLGIKNYGVREIAKCRDDKEKVSQLAIELFLFNLVASLFSYLMLGIGILTIPKFTEYKELLILFSSTIGFTTLGVEWLYGALEEYRYITIRTIVVQILSLILLFTLVKDKSDLFIYALILCASSVGSNIFNFIHAKKFICWKRYKLSLKKHMAPIFLLFAMELSISLYINLDSTMLGFLANDYEVGLYAAAVKINRMIVNVMSSIGVVLLPRLSYYFEKDEMDAFYKLANKAFQYLLMLAIPAAIGLITISDELMRLFSGNGYQDAVQTMVIMAPIIVIIPLNTLINSQLLLPVRKEKWVLISTCTSATINAITNFLLIPSLKRNGAAIGTVLAEIAGLLVCIYFSRKLFDIKTFFSGIWQYILAAIPIFVIGKALENIIDSVFIYLIVVITSSIFIYIVGLLLLKNLYLKEIYKQIYFYIMNIRGKNEKRQ